MKQLLIAEFPLEPFNTLVRTGKAGEVIGRVMDAIHPEAAYFTELDGKRGCILVVDVPKPSDIPRLAEPLFLALDAECRFRVFMTPDDLQQAGLEALGKSWA